ncbi:MAG TPA: START domain-containing protein [Bacteroidia bacterium]
MRILAFLLVSCFCFSQEKKDDWHLYKNENGIAVYSRKTVASGFKELKSVVTLKTSLNSVVALLSDWDSYPQWDYKCAESKTLKVISETEVMHYQSLKLPWPAEDQDFIINVKLLQDKTTRVVTIKSICNANYIPPVANRVRITEFNALWTLIPLKGGTVQLTYQFLANPGGMVPAWLANMAVLDGPYESMLNFKQWILKDKYQKAKSTYIKELTD